jgi:hypothetical protein
VVVVGGSAVVVVDVGVPVIGFVLVGNRALVDDAVPMVDGGTVVVAADVGVVDVVLV